MPSLIRENCRIDTVSLIFKKLPAYLTCLMGTAARKAEVKKFNYDPARMSPYAETFAFLSGGYRPKAYPGHAVLFKASDVDRGPVSRIWAEDSTFGWAEIMTGGIEVLEVPGDHVTILDEPSVSAIAMRIKSDLNRE